VLETRSGKSDDDVAGLSLNLTMMSPGSTREVVPEAVRFGEL
jgi:hypothetical protein